VAEELGLGQVRDQRRAVEPDEGARRPLRGLHQRLGHPLLAGAALAGEEHRDVPRPDPGHQRGQPAHRRRVEDHRPRQRQLARQPLVLGAQPGRLGGATHHRDQLVGLEGLAEVVPGARLDGLDRLPLRPVGRHQHHPRRRWPRTDSPQQLHAVHAGHPQVGEDQVGLEGLQLLERPDPVLGLLDLESLGLENFT
jgi:hypothetical protein